MIFSGRPPVQPQRLSVIYPSKLRDKHVFVVSSRTSSR